LIKRACLVLATACLLPLGISPAARAGLTWSAPVLVENAPPFANAPPINAVSCPSVGFCVGMEADGVVVSDRPTGGAHSWLRTSFAQVHGYSGTFLNALSCSSRHLCVAVDQNELLTSTHPDDGPGAWTAHSTPPNVSSISCPTRHLCVAATPIALYTTTRPQAGAAAWKQTALTGVQEVVCHGLHLCVAVSLAGGGEYVLSSTHPTGGPTAWHSVALGYPNLNFAYSGAACPSTRLCVITDSRGDVLSSTHPAQSRPRWKLARVPGVGRSVACGSPRLCVSVDTGTVATSTRPAGGRRSWTVTGWTSPPSGTPHVACGAHSVCVAVDQGDDILASRDPAAGGAAYSAVNLGQGYTPLSAVACPSSSLCIAQGGGRLLRTTDPTGGLTAWTQPGTAATTAAWYQALSCASPHFCGGISGTGEVSVGDPTLDPQTWVRGPTLEDTDVVTLACPSPDLCVGSDGSGDVVSSTDPAGGIPTWSTTQLNPPFSCDRYGCQYTPVTALSCPSTSLCVAFDRQGSFWISTDPGSGAWSRRSSTVSGSTLVCPDTHMCVTASAGSVAVTADPTDPSPSWSVTPLPNPTAPITTVPGAPPLPVRISGLACVSTQLCVAVDSNLGYAFVGDPAVTGQPWSASQLDITRSNPFSGPTSLTGVACTPTGLCVAIDGTGHVLTALASS
jgi:hypothetical protein